MLFLLFENILKNLYKASQNMVEYDQLYIKSVEDSMNANSLIERFKEAVLEYQKHELIIEDIDRSFFQR